MRSFAIRFSDRPLPLRRSPLLRLIGTGRWLAGGLWLAAGVAAGSLGADTASATPHAAHYHYMVGTRANYGLNVTKVLHHEASAPGIDLVLAKSNLETAVALASEIHDWADKTERAQPEEELSLVLGDLAAIRELTANIQQRTTALITTIDATLAQPLPEGQAMHAPSAELTAALVSSSREMFQLFQEILRAHKNAENAVGIPVPQDPPRPTASQ